MPKASEQIVTEFRRFSNYEKIARAALYAGNEHPDWYAIQYVADLLDAQPDEIGKVTLTMLFNEEDANHGCRYCQG